MKQHAITSIANKRLIIVAHSARALAQSSKRAGFEVIAVDGFADTDTQQACSACWCIPLEEGHFNSSKVVTCLQYLYKRYPHSRVLLGPGGEFYTSFIEESLPGWQVVGNSFACSRKITQPLSFFAGLDQLSIPYPEISLSGEMPTSGEWLRKSTHSCGGIGVLKVNHAEDIKEGDYYWQRELSGVPMSALVITDGEQYKIIGFNQQLVCRLSSEMPYVYSGAIANVILSQENIYKTDIYVESIIKYFNVIGVFSLDMLLVDQALVVLEVNPRISSTYELYEHIQPAMNLVDAHIRVCEGDALYEFEKITGLAGQQIVYAKQDSKIADVVWPEWMSDRPSVGENISAGEPLCSVVVVGDRLESVSELMQERAQKALSLLQN